MKHKTSYLILFTLGGFLIGCKSLHKTGLCSCENKAEAILGVYQRDLASLKSMNFIAVGSYPYEIELKDNHLLISSMKVKNDGSGSKSPDASHIKRVVYGKWRRLEDTVYLKIHKHAVSEELYRIHKNSLISLNKLPQAIWTK